MVSEGLAVLHSHGSYSFVRGERSATKDMSKKSWNRDGFANFAEKCNNILVRSLTRESSDSFCLNLLCFNLNNLPLNVLTTLRSVEVGSSTLQIRGT